MEEPPMTSEVSDEYLTFSRRKTPVVQAVIEKPLMENSTARSVSSSIAGTGWTSIS